MKLRLIFTFLLFHVAVYSQVLKIEPAGQKLKQVYLSMDVENRWIAGHHVNWQTGESDMPESKHGVKTHCCAFVAAACYQLNIYILRPPQHGQVLLANAQYDWLNTDAAVKAGWTPMKDDSNLHKQAQLLANHGKVVVSVYKNTDRSKPGHIALVIPYNCTEEKLINDGPEIIMAGTHNHNYIALKNGFKSHITSWPSHDIAFFVHDVLYSTIN